MIRIIVEHIDQYREENGIVKCYTVGELIRCKECKHYKWNDCFAEITREDGKKYYMSYIDSPSEDDYCSRAERKDNG